MSTKELLREFIPIQVDPSLITEAQARPNGTIRFKAVLQRANSKNQNGRVYPREILEREVDRYREEFVNDRRAVGELDHPESYVVEFKNAAINVAEIGWEGDDVIGIVEILSTPSGNIVKELIRNNIRIGISSRGVGSVSQLRDGDQVEDDFNLICFDVVSNPSTQGAFIKEGVEQALRNTKLDRINDLVVDFFGQIGDGK